MLWPMCNRKHEEHDPIVYSIGPILMLILDSVAKKKRRILRKPKAIK